MNGFAYYFKPISRERIGRCLFFIIICLCLLPAKAHAFDPEFEIIVPDVRGLKVEKAREILNGKGIKNPDINYESQSRKPKDTISRQEPNPGDALNITKPLKLWVSHPPETNIQVIKSFVLTQTPTTHQTPTASTAPSPTPDAVKPNQPQPEGGNNIIEPVVNFFKNLLISQLEKEPPRQILHAEITPKIREVRQGETAHFVSRTVPPSGIRKVWHAPQNLQATGEDFYVSTVGLKPDSYQVTLTVTDDNRQSTQASATLVVKAPEPHPPAVREPLTANIHVLKSIVRKGESAIFKSLSKPRECIREEWHGPFDQLGTGDRFKVETDKLEPGNYLVSLEVTNCNHQQSTARARFKVKSTEEHPLKFSARIIADKEKVRQSEPVTFTAKLTPERDEVFYRFYFGDGTESDLLKHPETRVTHKYNAVNTYEVFVKVLGRNERKIAESSHAFVVVSKMPQLPPPSPTPSPPVPSIPPPPPHNHTWLWIVISLFGGIGAGILISKMVKHWPPIDPKKGFRVEPRPDAGSQEITGDMPRLVGTEICLVPISDMGEQVVIEDQKPFVREEKWENE